MLSVLMADGLRRADPPYFASGACFGATLCCGTSTSPCFVSRSRSVVPSAEELVNEIVFSASGLENRSMGMHRLANNCLRISGRVNLRRVLIGRLATPLVAGESRIASTCRVHSRSQFGKSRLTCYPQGAIELIRFQHQASLLR